MALRRTSTASKDSDGEPGPVADRHLLYSPVETRTWVTLKEGYLLKTKIKTMRKSTKLRWFVLKQNPENLASRLEYYEGMSFRGAVSLESARIQLEKDDGVFLVHTPSRTFILQAEKEKLGSSTSWVLALQQAIVSHSRKANPKQPAPQPAPPAQGAAPRARGTHKKELDGNAIDAARWAALRKSMAPDVAPDPEDEDIIMMRRAEEEEERRQEEERLAWIASSVRTAEPAAPAEPAAASDEKGDVSEEEDFEEAMRLAEQQEEERQRREREEFLANSA